MRFGDNGASTTRWSDDGIRSDFRSSATRPTCCPRPSSRRCCPRRSSRTTSRGCWSWIPASTPPRMRDRALFELAGSSGLRAEELVDLDVTSIEFDSEQVRVEGKGSKTRFVPRLGEPAPRSIGAYLERAPPGARAARTTTPRFSCPGGENVCRRRDIRRRLRVWARHAVDADRGASARTPSFLRNAPARGRRGPAGDPGDVP